MNTEAWTEILDAPREVLAVQHINTDESALEIAAWVNSKPKKVAWVLPRGAHVATGAVVRIENQGRFKGPLVVFPLDYVLYDEKNNEFLSYSYDEFIRKYNKEKEEELMSTDKETPFTTPEPPHETNLGKDSIPADDVAQVQEETIVAEELATDE